MSQKLTLLLVEKNAAKQKRELYYTPEKHLHIVKKRNYWEYRTRHQDIEEFLTKVFLPAGYPQTVTQDYLKYQILNAAQAFCNSLASLLASRAVLEGIGVGDPSATSTRAMLLSVLQDAFGRVTTIIGAYYLGTFLVPEAKTYRFLADVLNDLAVMVDVFSPVLSTFLFPGARVVGLCTSAALRALCGVIAGGAKAAITLHFATPSTGLGDVGDLNAKDSSKETVLALLGMLLGSLTIPYITSAWATYPLLLLLISLHLAINYMAVNGLAIRSLNRQRTTIAWTWFHQKQKREVLSPQEAAKYELLLERPGILRDPVTRHVIGECQIGSAPLDVMRGAALSVEYIEIFSQEKYVVCFDPRTPLTDKETRGVKHPMVHICFREGYTRDDQLKGWLHGVEVCRRIAMNEVPNLADPEVAEKEVVKSAYQMVKNEYGSFRGMLKSAGWNLEEHHLMSGLGPKALLSAVVQTSSRKIPA